MEYSKEEQSISIDVYLTHYLASWGGKFSGSDALPGNRPQRSPSLYDWVSFSKKDQKPIQINKIVDLAVTVVLAYIYQAPFHSNNNSNEN